MSTIASIRDKITDALSTIDGLEVYKTVPSVANPPCVFPALRPLDPVEYDFTAVDASRVYHFYIEVLVLKAGTMEQSQDDIDQYLCPGDYYLKGTIEDIDWTGAADCCRVTQVTNYGPATYGGKEYLGARLGLDVFVSS